jgi:nitrite reductase/ring-hydroxylating ferredoxin subunit
MTESTGGPVLLARRSALTPGSAVAVPVQAGAHRVAVILLDHAGAVRAFLDSCPHTGVGLDWREGDFFDESGRYLRCSTHGALFRPGDGLCVAGPCAGASLVPVPVAERDGSLWLDDPTSLPLTARTGPA